MAFHRQVYLNEVVLVFSENQNGSTDQNLFLNQDSPSWLDWVEKLKDKSGVFYCCSKEQSASEVWDSFLLSFYPIAAAGGRVMNESNDVLMIFRREKWDLPKGKVDQGETIEAAALREVKEECGLVNVHLGKKLGIVFHLYFHKNKWILKDTHWFEMLGTIQDELVPQIEEDITSMCWMKAEEEEWKKNTFPSILEVMAW